ncbi:hypothetical protein ACIQUB_07115 [Rhizobium sp. NPDC090275]|uniref:hypothetical protein n=1 Tax=Rhizobium sp. NPDC090275 TaxID=3364498 RepID=UPI00383B0375
MEKATLMELVWIQNLKGFIAGKFPADDRWKAIFIEQLDLVNKEDAARRQQAPSPTHNVVATAADVNSAFDPANEAFGMAFRDGFKEGWVFAVDASGNDYQGACDAFKETVASDGMIMGEAFDAHRHVYFSMLPLASIPELGASLSPAPAERSMGRELPSLDDIDALIEDLLDAQQDINLAANETMSQPLCDASALIDKVEGTLLRIRAALSSPMGGGE